jgi:hypothetical protein
MGRVAVGAAGLVVAGAACAGIYFGIRAPGDGAAAQAASRDGARVFCLSAEARPRLAEAAHNLAVTIPPEGLRDGTGTEFDRVCAALVAAARLPQQGASTPAGSDRSTVDVLLPVVAGAVLTWSTGFWRDERTQSRLLAGALSTASHRYRSAVTAQRKKRSDGPQHGQLPVDAAVLDGRDELDAQLHKVTVLRPGWSVPRSLRERLADRRLGEGINDPRGQTTQQRDDELDKLLGELHTSIQAVVSALERPWRWHGEMRREPAPATEVTSR